jgi:uncharacterized protein
METFPITERTRARRRPQRASYDRETIYAILDAGFVCHVGFVDHGRPVVIPTAYARIDDAVVVHGAAKNRTLVALADGGEACVTVTHLDGLVLARSAFHHSVNYRSVMIFGRASSIEDPAGKDAALEAFFERIHPGRWAEVRPPSAPELAATLVIRIPIEEVSAKVRTGGPIDDAEDMSWPVWAGVVPTTLVKGEPIRDPASG